MTGPCLCGAEDCSRCYPSSNPRPRRRGWDDEERIERRADIDALYEREDSDRAYAAWLDERMTEY